MIVIRGVRTWLIGFSHNTTAAAAAGVAFWWKNKRDENNRKLKTIKKWQYFCWNARFTSNFWFLKILNINSFFFRGEVHEKNVQAQNVLQPVTSHQLCLKEHVFCIRVFNFHSIGISIPKENSLCPAFVSAIFIFPPHALVIFRVWLLFKGKMFLWKT